MTALIDTLKRQHRALERCVTTFDEAITAGQREAVKIALDDLRGALLAHLKLEDMELYPGLAQAGEPSSSARTIAETFASNMKRITEGLVGFFQNAERSEPARLAREWAGIKSVLSSRIESEERVLYPLYEREAARREKRTA